MPEGEADKFESKDRDFQDFGQQDEGMSEDSKYVRRLSLSWSYVLTIQTREPTHPRRVGGASPKLRRNVRLVC